jgi:hypothetical protein
MVGPAKKMLAEKLLGIGSPAKTIFIKHLLYLVFNYYIITQIMRNARPSIMEKFFVLW